MNTIVDSLSQSVVQDEERAAALHAWRAAAATLVVAILGLIGLFWEPAVAAVNVWSDSATYNHSFLIAPIVGYLIWERRVIFTQARPTPTYLLPALAVVIGSAAWLVANTATVYEVQQFAMFGILQCLLLAVLGWRVYFALAFPFFYLIFLVPSGEQLVPVMQDFTTWFIAVGLDLIGIPNYVDGVFISIPSGNFHVAEACAGLRFLIASVAYGFLFADLIYRDWKRRAIFVGLSVTIPIVANGFRALGIVLIAHYSDYKYAIGADHLIYGWGFFAAITLLLTWIGLKFRDAPDDWHVPGWARIPGQAARVPAISFAIAGALVLAVAAWGPAYATYLNYASPKKPAVMIALPDARAPWRAIEAKASWLPAYQNPGADKQQRYTAGGARNVDLHVVFYSDQRKGSELLSFSNEVQDESWRRISDSSTTLLVDGAPLDVNLRRIARGNTRRFVFSWYWVDGRFLTSKIGMKLAQVTGKLVTGRRAAAVVMLSIEANDEADALRIARDFLAAAGPIAPQLERVAASTK